LSRTKRNILSLILAVFFLHASLMGGVGILSRLAKARPDGKACQITLDVCGKLAPAASSQALETAPNIAPDTDYYFPIAALFPPSRDLAVASADPGDTEKPPKA